MEDEELTDYEKERLERIRANQEMLIKLGLKDKTEHKKLPKKRKREETATPEDDRKKIRRNAPRTKPKATLNTLHEDNLSSFFDPFQQALQWLQEDDKTLLSVCDFSSAFLNPNIEQAEEKNERSRSSNSSESEHDSSDDYEEENEVKGRRKSAKAREDRKKIHWTRKRCKGETEKIKEKCGESPSRGRMEVDRQEQEKRHASPKVLRFRSNIFLGENFREVRPRTQNKEELEPDCEVLASQVEGGVHLYLVAEEKEKVISWRSLDECTNIGGKIMSYISNRVYDRSRVRRNIPDPNVVSDSSMSNGTSKLVQTKKNEKKDTKDETEKKERRKGRVNVKSLKKMKVDEFIADIEAIEKRRFWHGEMSYLVRWKSDPEVAARYERRTNYLPLQQLAESKKGKSMVDLWEESEGNLLVEPEKPKDFLSHFWESPTGF